MAQKLIIKSLPFLLFFILFFSSCTDSEKKPADEISLEKKIGQMIFVGFRGTEVQPGDEIYTLIKDYNLGGVHISDGDNPSGNTITRNIVSKEQLKKLTAQLQAISPVKLLIGIDEEGGYITRLKAEKGFLMHRSHQQIGAINNPDTTRNWARGISEEIVGLGFNLNFAPVVDLNINPQSPAIGKRERSFSADPQVVLANAKIFIEELRKKNILCVPKHFPGHGSARDDSHYGLTDVTATWSENELLPYRELIKDGYCDIIMTAHVYNAKLDTVPATISPKIIQGVLRKELGFNGVIISDDLQMNAISNFYSFEQVVERALTAGVDILVFTNNDRKIPYDPEIGIKAIKYIKKLVQSGHLSEQRINESYERIEKLKDGI